MFPYVFLAARCNRDSKKKAITGLWTNQAVKQGGAAIHVIRLDDVDPENCNGGTRD